MFHFDRLQQRIFAIMGIVILILSGILIFKEYKSKADVPSDISLLPSQTWQNPDSTPSDNYNDDQDESKPQPVDVENKTIKVYITGRVKSPGVVTMYEGDRIEDAIRLAGGALPDADLARINLAMKVQDEGMYYVPAVGEEITEEPLVTGGEQNTKGRVNINKADQAQLETLPGIGPAKAQKIIEYREKHGGFKSIEEIMNVSGIGEKTYEGLKDLIDVR